MQETQETWVWSLDGEDPLEKEMATHSSILAWRIPWTEEPGRLQSIGSQTIRHDWLPKHTEALLPYEVALSLLQIQLRFHPWKSLCGPGIFLLRMTERQSQLTLTKNDYVHLCARNHSKSFHVLASSVFTTGKGIIILVLEIKKLRYKEMKHPASKSQGSSMIRLGPGAQAGWIQDLCSWVPSDTAHGSTGQLRGLV